MGLFDVFKGQFVDVIEWTDDRSDVILYRFPDNGEIMMGAKLTVRESQTAIFVNEGKIADVFEPGLYTLSTENLPVLTALNSWPHGFNSPFKSEVYYVNTKQFLNHKWGTTNPIMLRDNDFGIIRLRGYGAFSYRVNDPVQFMKEVSGTNAIGSTESITPQLKKQLLSGLTDLIGESKIPALELAMYYDELGNNAKSKLQSKFDQYGLELTDVTIENLSLPPEVEEAIDKRTSMNAIGDLGSYMNMQAADALRDAAQNEGGGLANAGVGVGAGMGMGQAITNAFSNTNNTQTNVNHSQNQSNHQEQIECSNCKQNAPKGSKFCSNCGQSLAPPTKACIECGHTINQSSKFCSNCGATQEKVLHCKECGTQLNNDSKFCLECGTKVGE